MIYYSRNNGNWFDVGNSNPTAITSPYGYVNATTTLNRTENLWYFETKNYKPFGLAYNRGQSILSISGSEDFTIQDINNALLSSLLIEGQDYINLGTGGIIANISIYANGYGAGTLNLGNTMIYISGGLNFSSSLKITGNNTRFFKHNITFVEEVTNGNISLRNFELTQTKVIYYLPNLGISITGPVVLFNLFNSTTSNYIKNSYVEVGGANLNYYRECTIKLLVLSVQNVTTQNNIYITAYMNFSNASMYNQNITLEYSGSSYKFQYPISTNSISKLIDCDFYLTNKAKNLLINSGKSVSEIAYELGFDYPNHFSKLFKSKTGVSPSEYRILN
jgi:hypothetical protein